TRKAPITGGRSEEVNTNDQKTPNLTKEQVEDAVEREVIGIIKDLVDQNAKK
ncbi:hypothetical protein KI387_025054, partial [Taxus chinensis]